MIKKIVISGCAGMVLVAFGVAAWLAFEIRSGDFFSLESGNSPQQMFDAVVDSSGEVTITNLEGVGHTWQGYALYLRFNSADFEPFLQNETYEWVECSFIQEQFILPDEFDGRFSPPWVPDFDDRSSCYYKNAVTNDWTHAGAHYFLIEEDQTIYFYGVGA